jgi:hypothetical protein
MFISLYKYYEESKTGLLKSVSFLNVKLMPSHSDGMVWYGMTLTSHCVLQIISYLILVFGY